MHRTPIGSDRLDDPRQIAKWTRVYAQNRSLPFIVSMLLFLVLSVTIGALSYLTAYAYVKGYNLILSGCILVLALTCAAVIYVSIPRWGGRLLEQLSQTLYAKEGSVTVSTPQTAVNRRRWGLVLGIGYGACILASIVVGMLGYIPHEYMQPVSAIYVVPFFIALGILTRPSSSPVMMLWPILYALHAVLIVAGAPILFTGKWDSLNMLVPIAGYGLLCGLLAHLYSRFALRRLKRLNRMELLGTHDSDEERS